MLNVFSLAFEQCFFSVVFRFCKFYLVSCTSLASSVSAGCRSERCWPISPLTAAQLLCFAQGRFTCSQARQAPVCFNCFAATLAPAKITLSDCGGETTLTPASVIVTVFKMQKEQRPKIEHCRHLSTSK